VPYQLTGYNPYDMRIKCQKPPLCYDFSGVENFLNAQATQQQLGVSKKWESCNRIVNMAFQKDYMRNYHTKLPEMLADDIKVLIYAGDVDYICNWLGNKKWALALDWQHKADFNAAEDKPYMVDGKQAGRIRTSNGFHFMQVYQAGHMVPLDQPAAALSMLNDFIAGKLSEPGDFADSCTGGGDPNGQLPRCYVGSKDVLGASEKVQVKITSFANGAGNLDFTGSGVSNLDCKGKAFKKSGQTLSGDWGGCAPGNVAVKDIKYCSDSDTISATVKVKDVFLPITTTLTRSGCSSAAELVI